MKDEKVTLSLFIDKAIVESLKEQSKAMGVSLNSRANSVLSKYTNFTEGWKTLEH